MKRKYKIVLALAPILVIADQFTKWLVYSGMYRGQNIPVIPDFLSWHFLINRGAAFGMFRGLPDGLRGPFFLVVGIAAMAVILYYLVKSADDKIFFPICLTFVLSGAIGNLTDRIRLGYVVDFILVEATFMGQWVVELLDEHFGTHLWPSFNVADSLIVVGIVGMAVDLLFFTPIEEEGESESDDASDDEDDEEDQYRKLSFTPDDDTLTKE